jgi:hypothetical protein
MYAFWLRRFSDFSQRQRTSLKNHQRLLSLPDTEK